MADLTPVVEMILTQLEANCFFLPFCRLKVLTSVMTPYGTTEAVDIFYARNRMGDYSSKLVKLVAELYSW